MAAIAVDHCVSHVSDWRRSNAFCRDLLGAEIVERGAGFAGRFGSRQLDCHGPGLVAEPPAHLPVQPGNIDLCSVSPGSIAEAAAHRAAQSVAVERGPVARHVARGQAERLCFRDPDATLLEFNVHGD